MNTEIAQGEMYRWKFKQDRVQLQLNPVNSDCDESWCFRIKFKASMPLGKWQLATRLAQHNIQDKTEEWVAWKEQQLVKPTVQPH